MDLGAYVDALDRLDALHARGEYDAVYEGLSEMLAAWPGSADLLVRRGRVAQLREDGALEDVRLDLETALVLAPDSAAAHLELGHYAYAVEDDPEAGLAAFERARLLAAGQRLDALVGQVNCLMELGRLDEARRLLADAVAQGSDAERLDDLRRRLDG